MKTATSFSDSEADFQETFRAAVDREARADLVEKRKQTEAELEAGWQPLAGWFLRWFLRGFQCFEWFLEGFGMFWMVLDKKGANKGKQNVGCQLLLRCSQVQLVKRSIEKLRHGFLCIQKGRKLE